MGNTQKKPCQNIELFIEVQKNNYESGDVINGKINLNIKKNEIPYYQLIIGFYCKQSFLEKASKYTNPSYQTSQIFSYQGQKTLCNFKENKLSQGQYAFPFQIKLPQNLPSNFSIENLINGKPQQKQNIHLRYAIKAQLNGGSSNKYGNLIKVHYLNILKPYKNLVHPLNHEKSQITNYCMCLQGGATKISIFVNKNFAQSGQILEINGQIDNTYGKSSFDGLNCQLIQKNIVSDQKNLFYKQKQRGILHIVKQFYVKRGNIQNFSFSYKIPDYLQNSHSIGNFSALVYKLRFQYKFKNGCDSNKKIDFPLQIQTKTPKLEANIDEIPSSYQWNPKVEQLTVFDMQKPFQFNNGYPLEHFRSQQQSFKAEIPSFNYFDRMNAGYLTKQNWQYKKKSDKNPSVNQSVQPADSQKPMTTQEAKVPHPKGKIFVSNKI